MTDSLQMPNDELARAWWKYFGSREWDAERLRSGVATIDDLTAEIYVHISKLGQDPGQLGSLLESLVEGAPVGALFSFIGTSILEDAYAAMGARAFLILENSSIKSRIQKEILSGFLF